jgi:hypothetical protein
MKDSGTRAWLVLTRGRDDMGADEARYVIWAVIGLLGLAVWGPERHRAGHPQLARRQAELQSFARRRGLSYVSEHASWAWRWPGPPFHGRFYHCPTARNVMTGRDGQGRPLVVFDYEYRRGRTTTRMTVCVVQLPRPVHVPPSFPDTRPPHDPPLHVRWVGDDVVCWSDSQLHPKQILTSVAWLNAVIDGLPASS